MLVDKYLGDTLALTTEQHGAYFLLLLAMWKAGGVLPDDDTKLASIAKLTATRWRAMSPTIRAFLRSDGSGGLTQKRLVIELRKAAQHVTAGQKGARMRWRSHGETDGERHGERHGEHDGETGGGVDGERHGEPHGEPHGKTMLHTHTETSERKPNGLLSPVSHSLIEADASNASGARAYEGERITAGEAFKAIKATGMSPCNPSHPTLLAMIALGITMPELVDAASVAVERGKGFAWALERAIGKRADAAQVALAPAVPANARKQWTDAIRAGGIEAERAIAEQNGKGHA